MNKFQQAYFLARVELNDARKVAEPFYYAIPVPDEDATDEEILVYITQIDLIDLQFNIPELEKRAHLAENTLLEWAHNRMQLTKGYSEEIEDLFAKADKNNVIRERILEISMRIK